MSQYYDRYNQFKVNGTYKPLPFIKIKSKSTDKQVEYLVDRDRLDKLSQEYYGSPYYGWLILLANPQFGGLEFNIVDQSIIVIPYPFDESLQQYINEVNNYKKFYGI